MDAISAYRDDTACHNVTIPKKPNLPGVGKIGSEKGKSTKNIY